MTKPIQPCKGCGGKKQPGQGQRYCIPCADLIKPMHEREQYRRRLERSLKARKEAGTDRKLAVNAPKGKKWCARCQQYLPVDEFGKRGQKLAAYCKPCSSAYMHARALAREFGLTPDAYQELWDLQQGRCAICETRPRKRRLAVDHDHETGAIRGLLCTRCNHKLLGAAHESGAMLRRAARYLDDPPAVTWAPVPADDSDSMELVMSAALDDANTEARNANAAHGVAWIKRRGRPSALDGYVVMDGHTFLNLLRDAGY